MSTSFQDPRERMRHARAAMRDQFHAEAREQLVKLGITPTDEQVAQAGERLLKAAQQARMAAARATRWDGHAEEKRVADMEWGVRQVHRYATLLHTWAPGVPDSEQTRIALMAMGDEVRSPDGFSRPRLVKRLQALVDHVKAQHEARSVQLDRTLREPVDFDALPSLDDLNLDEGLPTWSGLTDDDVR